MRKPNPDNIEQQLLQAAVRGDISTAANSKVINSNNDDPAADRTNKPKIGRSSKKAETIQSAQKESVPTVPLISAFGKDRRQTVIVCFGTTSISGDSLGPMVGSMLTEKYNIPAFVYGTEQHCVNGKNMKEWISFITAAHKDALFIAIDASLGQEDRVGKIVIRDDGVCPAAIKGKRTRFGDIGILAVVAENKGDALMQLMSVSQVYVAELADKVSIMVKTALFGE